MEYKVHGLKFGQRSLHCMNTVQPFEKTTQKDRMIVNSCHIQRQAKNGW